MREFALVFPGQGVGYVGMGKKFLDSFPLTKQVFSKAREILGYSLEKLCWEGSSEELDRTLYSQPAIFTLNYLYWRLFSDKVKEKPQYVCGHSLGEYSAILAAGGFDFETGLYLVKKRAELMDQASLKNEGGMVALLGIPAEKVKSFLSQSKLEVEISNYNCPGQVVISGKVSHLSTVVDSLKPLGLKKEVRLPLSGPFHSSWMKGAQQEFSKMLKAQNFSDLKIPLVCNYKAKILTKGDELKEALAEQMTHSVLWQQSIELLLHKGVQSFLEIGPGEVLKGLIGRISKEATCYSMDAYEDIDRFISATSQVS